MPNSPAEIRQQLRAASQLPYGVARTATTESIVRRVEADGPAELLPEALLELLEAYTFGGAGTRSFVTFARLLRLWDEHPEHFDSYDTHRLLWGFKWIAGETAYHPDITLAQGEALLADMAHRYAVAGQPQSAVLGERFGWLWHLGSPAAEEARLAWITAGRDELGDCAACVIGQQVDFFVETGRYLEAVELGVTQRDSCNLEPSRTLYALALAQLLTGDVEAAAASHLAGRGQLGPDSGDFAPGRGQELELLLRGGHLGRALQRLRDEHAGYLEQANSPLLRLRFLLGLLAGLAANRDAGDTPTGLTSIEAPTLADLLAWVEREARALAAQFDARGDTTYYTDLVTRALRATRAGVLPLEVSPQPATAEAEPGPTEENPTADPLAEAEHLQHTRRYREATLAYEEAAHAARAEGRLSEAGLALAEAGRCADLAGDDATAHRLYSAAWPLLTAGGADAELLVKVTTAWAPVAARSLAADALLPPLEQALSALALVDLSGLADSLAERRQRDLAVLQATAMDTKARTIASLTHRGAGTQFSEAAELASSAAEAYAHAGSIADAAHSFWLAGRLLRDLGDTDGATYSLESAVEGFALAHQVKETAEAASDLIELLRATGRAEQAEAVARSLVE